MYSRELAPGDAAFKEDTTVELKPVFESAADIFYAARQGQNAVMQLAVNNMKAHQFNNLARQHNERVLAARAQRGQPVKSQKPREKKVK